MRVLLFAFYIAKVTRPGSPESVRVPLQNVRPILEWPPHSGRIDSLRLMPQNINTVGSRCRLNLRLFYR